MSDENEQDQPHDAGASFDHIPAWSSERPRATDTERHRTMVRALDRVLIQDADADARLRRWLVKLGVGDEEFAALTNLAETLVHATRLRRALDRIARFDVETERGAVDALALLTEIDADAEVLSTALQEAAPQLAEVALLLDSRRTACQSDDDDEHAPDNEHDGWRGDEPRVQ